jgi:hypothetical protein
VQFLTNPRLRIPIPRHGAKSAHKRNRPMNHQMWPEDRQPVFASFCDVITESALGALRVWRGRGRRYSTPTFHRLPIACRRASRIGADHSAGETWLLTRSIASWTGTKYELSRQEWRDSSTLQRLLDRSPNGARLPLADVGAGRDFRAPRQIYLTALLQPRLDLF